MKILTTVANQASTCLWLSQILEIIVYKDADRINHFRGTVDPLNSRIVLLDAKGKVIWFHDRGYSASKISELDRIVRTFKTRSSE